MQPLDPQKDIILQTDASTSGTGFLVLQKGDDGKLHACFYGGHALTNQQARYCASDLELIAVIQALKAVEWCGLHRRITIFTDNARVVYLKTWHPLNNCLLYTSPSPRD